MTHINFLSNLVVNTLQNAGGTSQTKKEQAESGEVVTS